MPALTSRAIGFLSQMIGCSAMAGYLTHFFAQCEAETVHADLLSEFAAFVSSVGSGLGAAVLAEAASVGR